MKWGDRTSMTLEYVAYISFLIGLGTGDSLCVRGFRSRLWGLDTLGNGEREKDDVREDARGDVGALGNRGRVQGVCWLGF